MRKANVSPSHRTTSWSGHPLSLTPPGVSLRPAQNGVPGLSEEFWTAYHFTVPREPGFQERHDLYQLFHLVNHTCLRGDEYLLMAEDAARRVLESS